MELISTVILNFEWENEKFLMSELNWMEDLFYMAWDFEYENDLNNEIYKKN